MKLQQAPKDYDRQDQSQVRRALEQADDVNWKKGQDLRMERGERFIRKASSGGKRFQMYFDATGRPCLQEV